MKHEEDVCWFFQSCSVCAYHSVSDDFFFQTKISVDVIAWQNMIPVYEVLLKVWMSDNVVAPQNLETLGPIEMSDDVVALQNLKLKWTWTFL